MPDDKFWASYFISQARQSGHGNFDVFSAAVPYQRGRGIGNIFKNVFRFLLPLAKKAGKAIGREGLKATGRLAEDILSGKDIKTSVKRNAKKAAGNLLTTAGSKLQKGDGKKKTIKRKKVVRKKSVVTKRRKFTDIFKDK